MCTVSIHSFAGDACRVQAALAEHSFFKGPHMLCCVCTLFRGTPLACLLTNPGCCITGLLVAAEIHVLCRQRGQEYTYGWSVFAAMPKASHPGLSVSHSLCQGRYGWASACFFLKIIYGERRPSPTI